MSPEGESILIVDDEQPVRHMLSRLLEGSGYTVIQAESAEHALEVLEGTHADVVITDLKMPGMDGLSLAQKLLKMDPDRPVLLMTAFGDLESARRAVGIGIYEYFTKPVDVNDVIAGVNRAAEHRRLVLENRAYQKDLERKVEERTRELEQAYKILLRSEKLSAVGQLAAGVVHEVLNPLSVVLGRIDMALMNRLLDATSRTSLQIAREQVCRAVEIMDNLRDLSRQRPPQRTAVDINGLVSCTLELVAHDSNRQSVDIVPQLGVLPLVQADQADRPLG